MEQKRTKKNIAVRLGLLFVLATVLAFFGYSEQDSTWYGFLFCSVFILIKLIRIKSYIQCQVCLNAIPSRPICPICGNHPNSVRSSAPVKPGILQAQPIFQNASVSWNKKSLYVALLASLWTITAVIGIEVIVIKKAQNSSSDTLKAIEADRFEVFDEFWKKNHQFFEANAFSVQKKIIYESPLCTASALGKKAIVDYLLAQGMNPNEESRVLDDVCLPIFAAVANGHMDIFESLLKAGAKIDVMNSGGNSLAHVAVKGGNMEIIEEIFSKGISLNITNSKNQTPLHFAVKYGRAKAISFLRQKGALLDVKDQNGNTPLDLAIQQKREDLVSLLAAH